MKYYRVTLHVDSQDEKEVQYVSIENPNDGGAVKEITDFYADCFTCYSVLMIEEILFVSGGLIDWGF